MTRPSPERMARARERVAAEVAAAGGLDAWADKIARGEISLLSQALEQLR